MPPRVPDDHLDFARRLRNSSSAAEAMLWRSLKNRGLKVKFRRQMPIGPYVADFACVAAKLIVELDGRPHDATERQERDRDRDAWFAEQGWRVIRLPNDIVLGGGNIALERIRTALGVSPHPTLADARVTFSREAGEGNTSR